MVADFKVAEQQKSSGPAEAGIIITV